MSNEEKLKELITEIFILADTDFRFDLTRDEIPSWDSLGTVSLAVGVQEVFGYHMTPAEATRVKGVQDIVRILEVNGIPFHG